MKVTLRIETKKNKMKYELLHDSAVVFGRSNKANCQIDDSKMSSLHCKITFKNNVLDILDLESKNGVFLNGIRIEQSEIFLGDQIKLGETKIILEEKGMSSGLANMLSFPGKTQERMNYELKADFTGARISNQMYKKQMADGNFQYMYHEKEIALRKRGKTRIKLSKDEIKYNHNYRSIIASTIDSLLTIVCIAVPGFVYYKHQIVTNSFLYFCAAELIIFLTFVTINFKLLKFTLGEMLVGIKELYDKQ